MWYLPCCCSLYCLDFKPQIFQVLTLTFQGHMTSQYTCTFDFYYRYVVFSAQCNADCVMPQYIIRLSICP